MPQQGWNQEQAVASCLRKGRFRGVFNDDIKKAVKVTRYQTSIKKMTYDQYKKWKESHPSN